jgi:response regulator RpfG family c-di-GMP phosphodiesterase
MYHSYDFFLIEKSHLKDGRTFPFQIFVHNPSDNTFMLFLTGNQPLTKHLNALLDSIIESGATLAVLRRQKRTFLKALELNPEDIPSLANGESELTAAEKEHIMNTKYKEMYEEKHGPFNFQHEFQKACDTDNFEKLIEYAQIDFLSYNQTISHTMCLAHHFIRNFLVSDNYINRIVATSYFFTKTLNINDPESLGDVVCAAYLANVGYSQLPLNMLKTPTNNLSRAERKLFEKHTILGNHLIKKNQLDLTDRCKKIILDHHERTNGSGYPTMKAGNSIDILSQIVGSIYHIFEYSSGKINGTKSSIRSIIVNIKSRNYQPGLEIDFGDDINYQLAELINTEQIDLKKVA